MMGKALYRDYRPKSFSEVVGQDHITTTLENAIKNGKISHAYLLTGPRGVGKTSVARILAHEVNKLPYNDESIHLDIIEIDAASNRRIDEIRDLRDKVRIAPAQAKYKVYIIDEVHMLTKEAFNALLKTLEEPPAHCIFILATTEAHKLPETIISRTQRFEFKPLGRAAAAEHLASIAKQESIDIDKPALDLLAEFGQGSFRDSISYLDQLSSYGKKINENQVRDLLGLPAQSHITSLLKSLESGDGQAVLQVLEKIEHKGINAAAAAAAVSAQIRESLKHKPAQSWQLNLLKRMLSVSASHRPQEALEINLLSICAERAQTKEFPHPQTDTTKKLKPTVAPILNSMPEATKIKSPVESSTVAGEFDMQLWDLVVQRAKDEAASIYTALRLAEPSYSDKVLTLKFQFPLHRKKLEQAKNKQLVSQLIREVSGEKVSVVTALGKDKLPPIDDIQATVTPASLGAISNIFGNAEVLES